MFSVSMEERRGPELVIGLVGAVGADMDLVVSGLESAFSDVGYETRSIRLIEGVLRFKPWATREATFLDERINARMTAGTEFRERIRRRDALALQAVTAIRVERKRSAGRVKNGEERPIPRCAYLLRSLKTPEEVSTLRKVYGANCFIIAAYAPESDREAQLARQVAESRSDAEHGRHRKPALDLIQRDAREHGRPFGQNVRGTFHLADIFVDVSEPIEARESLQRFVELVFGHPFRTPARAECAMHHAHGEAMRSSSAGRQVGAAIANDVGDVLAVGANEVPKPFGGQVWEEDGEDNDGRDHKLASDPNTSMTKAILADFVARLQKARWLKSDLARMSLQSCIAKANAELLNPMTAEPGEPLSLSDSARLTHIIEFIRAVHAEMATLVAAARLGISVDGATLYSTTFPCHECARHIVAAGIRKVVFIEPYPKSKVAELYDDSIAIDRSDDPTRVGFVPFVGVAPRRFLELFSAPERKTSDGAWIDWNAVKRTRDPRTALPAVAYLEQEADLVDMFHKLIAGSGLALAPELKARKKTKKKTGQVAKRGRKPARARASA